MANAAEWQQGYGVVDRPAVLRKIVDLLSVKGFANVSMAELTTAVGIGRSALQKAFGSREEILRAAIFHCADTEACLAYEPLSVCSSAREAIRAMLEESIRLHTYWPRSCDCLFTSNSFIAPPNDAELHKFIGTKRSLVFKRIRSRLIQAVNEGELPEKTNCEALAGLCVIVLSGITVRVVEGAPSAVLFRSVDLFVDTLGFRDRIRRAESSTKASRKIGHRTD